MASKENFHSNKFNLIDRTTYEKIQNNETNDKRQQPIRNSKYKKTHKAAQFSLLDFLKVKRKKKPSERHRRPARLIVGGPAVAVKRRGKKREHAKKRHTRLKQSILSYRKLKLEEARNELRTLDQAMNQLTLHSRRFRDYCDNCTTPRLAELTGQLLRDLNRFQKRAFAQNPFKARAHRRLVLGFREAENFLQVNKVKLLIIAPDCEQCAGEAGLDETISNIKSHCQRLQVPYVFSLKRRQLAYVLFKKVPVSCVAVLDYDGANSIYAELLLALAEAREEYKNRTEVVSCN